MEEDKIIQQEHLAFVDEFENLISILNFPENLVAILRDLFMLATLLIICLLAFYISKFLIKRIIKRLVSRTKTQWDDSLFKNKFFSRISYLIPAILIIKLIPYTLPYSPGWGSLIISIANIYIVLIIVLAIFSFLDSFIDIFNTWDISQNKSIKGYVQLLKILIAFVSVVLVIAILIQKSPLVLLGGLGALSAVLLLIFKDALLGFVAGIQLSANDMARPGDWITMQKYNADGNIEEITLTTVKVRNFDRTLVYLPAYVMISDSFVNWRGMYETEGRRIKRALSIDINSVKFCDEHELENLKKFALVRDYIIERQIEIDKYNKSIESDLSIPVNGRRQTNLGIFRAYIEAYLRSLPTICQDTILMVRQMPPLDKGIPLEVYAFCIYKEWVEYEVVQSDIFDHLIAALPSFGLKLYQTPTGGDVHAFISKSLCDTN